MPRGESVIQLSGSHLSASTTEETVEMETIQMVIGQTPDLTADMNLDYLPEVENFEVQLKKDAQGLGITIAGYVCERGKDYLVGRKMFLVKHFDFNPQFD